MRLTGLHHWVCICLRGTKFVCCNFAARWLWYRRTINDTRRSILFRTVCSVLWLKEMNNVILSTLGHKLNAAGGSGSCATCNHGNKPATTGRTSPSTVGSVAVWVRMHGGGLRGSETPWLTPDSPWKPQQKIVLLYYYKKWFVPSNCLLKMYFVLYWAGRVSSTDSAFLSCIVDGHREPGQLNCPSQRAQSLGQTTREPCTAPQGRLTVLIRVFIYMFYSFYWLRQ